MRLLGREEALRVLGKIEEPVHCSRYAQLALLGEEVALKSVV